MGWLLRRLRDVADWWRRLLDLDRVRISNNNARADQLISLCLTSTNWPCFGEATYKLKYTESDISPSTTDGTANPNTWYSWKCWPCENCGSGDEYSSSDAEPSKNNSLAYASASKTENDERKLFARLEHPDIGIDEEHNNDHVDMSERDGPDGPINADMPADLDGTVIHELFADDLTIKASNKTVEASDEATAHLVRAAMPKFRLHLPSSHHKSTPSPKSKNKKCNNTTGDCSDAASIVPMRKLLGVAVGVGFVAGAGL